MKRIKLIISVLLTAGCIIAIFVFSSQEKAVSGANSFTVLKAAAEVISKVFNVQISEAQVRGLHNFFRKTAHFSIYAVLAVFSYNTFRLAVRQKRYAVTAALVFCVLMAVSDEIHQYFVPGRSAEVRDVCIDTLGVCFGLGLVWIGNVIVKNAGKLKKKKQYIKYKSR